MKATKVKKFDNFDAIKTAFRVTGECFTLVAFVVNFNDVFFFFVLRITNIRNLPHLAVAVLDTLFVQVVDYTDVVAANFVVAHTVDSEAVVESVVDLVVVVAVDHNCLDIDDDVTEEVAVVHQFDVIATTN